MAKAAKKSAVPAKKKVVAPVEKKQTNKKAAKKEKVVVKAASPIGALAKYYKAQAVVLDKKLDLMSGHSIFAEPISTGSLVVNYVLSGGIFPIFNQVSGMEGSGKCLVSNTLVKTDLGYVEFGEFISKKGFAPVTGAKIQTPLGIEDYSHTYKEKAATIKIKTGNGFSVEGTADHPMLVIDENLNHAWRKLSEIRVGDWIASVNQQVDLLGTSEEVSLPMATILGNLTANGRGSRFYSFDEKVVERFVEAVMQETGSYPSLVWQPDGKEVSYYNILGRGKGDKGGEGTYYESTLVPLGYKGASSKEKCIPYTVRTSSSKEVLHEFLEAYFECDCGVNGDQIELVTSSPTLSRQLHVILAQEYGVVGKRTVVFSSAANSKKPSVKKYHSIALTGDNAVKFLETFKRAKAHAYLGRFKGKRSNSGGSETDVVPYVRAYTNGVYARRKVGDKPEVSQYVAQDGTILHNFARPNYIKPGVVGYRDNHYVSRKTFEKEDWNNFIPHVDKLCPTLAKKLKALLDQNYRYEKVVSVKAKSKKKWVYDVSVPKSRSFIANGLVSHNTTLMLSTLAHAYNDGVPFIEVTDAEGTIAPEYAANMFKSFNISDIFEEGSTARYYPNEILDTFADKASGILKVMPDKVWLPEANTWAYAVKKGADRRASALVSALRNSGLKEDAALSKQGTGGRWIFPTDYRGPEGLIMVDSWPALMTEKVDEEGQSNQMAGNATPLAKALPRFAGKLRRKGVSLFSINQIRENPGARWGSPLYEPGGNTLKHATACRLRMHSRAVPAGESKDPDNGSLGYEKSVTGNGYDYYAYKAVENTKHKMGRPFLKGMIRIWVADVDGVARGIDPMYDTWNYLKTTGQIAGTRANFKFVFRKTITSTSCLALQGTSWKYEELKKLVIAEHFGYKELLKEIAAEKGFNKKPNLRDCLFQQIKNDKDLWSTKELMVEEEDYEDDNYEDDDDE